MQMLQHDMLLRYRYWVLEVAIADLMPGSVAALLGAGHPRIRGFEGAIAHPMTGSVAT